MVQDANKNGPLLENEHEITSVKVHPVVFLQPLIMYLASLYLMLHGMENMKLMGFFLLFVATGVVFYSLLRFKELRLTLTNHRLLLRTGLLKIKYVGYYLDEVVELEVQKSFLGKLFNFGNLWVELTSGRVYQLRPYSDLEGFEAQVNQQQQLYYQDVVARRTGSGQNQASHPNAMSEMGQPSSI
jgi:uncharacterized membrane protein YdbT with pleckstrin-like domain